MPDPHPRHITITVPAALADWLHGFAEISHQSIDDVVRPLLEAERSRIEANWDPDAAERAAGNDEAAT